MKYPKLVPASVCKTPIIITLYTGEITEDGAPEVGKRIETKCNYQSSSKRIYTEQKTFIELSAVALIGGDIDVDSHELHGGVVEIPGGETHTISSASKCRNPDGTVNYTKLELI